MACSTEAREKLSMVNGMAVRTGTKTTFLCAYDGRTQGTVYDYKYNIVGDVRMTYENDHLIVYLENGFIQPSGSGTYPTSKPTPIVWYGSLSNPLPCWRAIAIGVSLNPDYNSADWHKCLGGWYARGTNCNTTCTKDKYGNFSGGTIMYWDDNQAGTPFEKGDYQRGGRRIPTQRWDLGAVSPSDGIDLKVYFFARGEQSCSWNHPGCPNIPFAPSSIPRVEFNAPVCPLPPPVLDHIAQKQHVCENCADAYLTFEGADFNGLEDVILVVDYKYEGETDWGTAKHRTEADEGEPATVKLPCLIPMRKVYWRAQYMTTKGFTSKSEYTYGEFDVIFVPPAWMEVPPVSIQECTLIQQGKPVPEFLHLTDYHGADFVFTGVETNYPKSKWKVNA